MLRRISIVMTMIFTKLMTNPLRVRETTKGTKTACILELLRQSVNEATELDRMSSQVPPVKCFTRYTPGATGGFLYYLNLRPNLPLIIRG